MYDVIIIGAGISGAAVAYELSRYNLKLAIIEKCNDVSCGTTKANSAIIHAGYDPRPGSLMAKLNVRGSRLTEQLCKQLDIPYKKCGAFVVGFDADDLITLEQLERQAKLNGVEGCRLISGEQARELEPQLSKDVIAALDVPESAIICPWEFCLALVETSMKNGAELFLNSEVVAIERDADGSWDVSTSPQLGTQAANSEEFASSELQHYRAPVIINAAGVSADKIHDLAAEHSFDILPTVGEYYLLDKPEGQRVGRTIFQCPNELGKGVLVTPTVHGNLIVGPNIRVVDGNDTSTTADSLRYVKTAGSKSVPTVDFATNIRNYAGVRARTDRGDFIIEEAAGAPGFFDVAGICSPGLASALAIGEYVSELVKESGIVDLEPRGHFINSRKRTRFNELSPEEKQLLVARHPAYGHVVCRCNTVTEGEVLDAFQGPIPPCSLDGVKRRVGSSMGRCQGGFCSTQIMKIIAEHYNISEDEVMMDADGSWILKKDVRGGRLEKAVETDEKGGRD